MISKSGPCRRINARIHKMTFKSKIRSVKAKSSDDDDDDAFGPARSSGMRKKQRSAAANMDDEGAADDFGISTMGELDVLIKEEPYDEMDMIPPPPLGCGIDDEPAGGYYVGAMMRQAPPPLEEDRQRDGFDLCVVKVELDESQSVWSQWPPSDAAAAHDRDDANNSGSKNTWAWASAAVSEETDDEDVLIEWIPENFKQVFIV